MKAWDRSWLFLRKKLEQWKYKEKLLAGWTECTTKRAGRWLWLWISWWKNFKKQCSFQLCRWNEEYSLHRHNWNEHCFLKFFRHEILNRSHRSALVVVHSVHPANSFLCTGPNYLDIKWSFRNWQEAIMSTVSYLHCSDFFLKKSQLLSHAFIFLIQLKEV